MRLEREGKRLIDRVTKAQLVRAIKSLRSYGPSSFASLTDESGN
jgi:hypothetical protein